jgi:archaemetzincin
VSAVHVLPLGTLEDDIVLTIDHGIRKTFGLDVQWLSAEETPAYAFDTARQQYSSELILRNLMTRCPEGALRFFAVTDVDLFIPMLTFVYGQAQLSGKVSVVSTARMHQEFYTLAKNRPLTLSRIRKESLHELGHTFGLTHCPLPTCLMSIATTVDQLDAKGEELCRGCVRTVREGFSRIAGTHDQSF